MRWKIFSTCGTPKISVSDNAQQFTLGEFRRFFNMNTILHKIPAQYHRSTDLLADRIVQTLKQFLRLTSNDIDDLQLNLNTFLLQYRITSS